MVLSNRNNTVDANKEDVLEEEDDFEEELSSSEDEKKRKGYESDGSWHLSSEEDELFDDSDGSASSCDSDWLEETERQRQKERRKHNLKRKKKTLWVCKCQEKFTSEKSYRKHKLEAHPVTCEYCDMKFPSARTFEKHLKTHLPSEDKLDLKGNKLFLCDHCGQFFNNKDFKRHELALSEASPYKCEWKNCKSTFKRMFTLKNHVRHVHEKNCFPCPYEGCEKTFGVRSVMMKHYKVHTDERSHQCSYCGKMFQRPDHLRVHTRIHTGATPFNCSLCNYGGRQANCLRWHMKTHHPEHCKKSGKSGDKKGGRPRKKV
ncbi:zinc finger protein 271-like [Branchiostoma floridae]|uniref:Zinc finger protein 271-like n=1 Tax=Branchiostoma floridae TaxID=7739 RepID=A0A9J7HT79_BRAFL|nr:zinc finger protein 271-like [Branchiostoma floridae]